MVKNKKIIKTMNGDKGMFQCRGDGCTAEVDFVEPKDCKCPKCGKRYGYVKGRYKEYGRLLDLAMNL